MDLSNLKPINTPCRHWGHGPGKIAAYNTSPGFDLDQKIEQLRAIKDEGASLSKEEDHLLNAVFVGAALGGIYGGDRYPYVVKFEPTEKYPEGFQEVYSHDEIIFEGDDGYE